MKLILFASFIVVFVLLPQAFCEKKIEKDGAEKSLQEILEELNRQKKVLEDSMLTEKTPFRPLLEALRENLRDIMAPMKLRRLQSPSSEKPEELMKKLASPEESDEDSS